MNSEREDRRAQADAAEGVPDASGVRLCGQDDLPPPSACIRIWSQRLRLLGSCADALILCYVEPPYSLFLVPDADGTPGLLGIEPFRRLMASGAAEILPYAVPPPGARPGEGSDARMPDRTTKIMTQCDMLNAAHVPNGVKSIAIYLHQHWTPDLISRFGMPDNPHTIRRWRKRRRPEPPV